MNHCKTGRKFSRERNQRRALLRTLAGSLIIHEKITTTEAKAKELKSVIDRLITISKKGKDSIKKVTVIRELQTRIPNVAVKKLMSEFGSKFSVRTSGYTRIIKLSPRKSDSARMAVIEFV